MSSFKAFGPAIVAFNGEDIGGVVAPGETTGKLEGGHDLNRVDAERFEMREPADDTT